MATSTERNSSIDIRGSRASRIATQIRARVESGDFPSGMMLPARRALATEFKVSLATLESGIKSLIAEGYLRAENGRGTFVRDNPPRGKSASGQGDAHPEIHRESGGMSATDRPVLGIVTFLDPDYEKTHPGRVRNSEVVLDAFERVVTEMNGVSHFVNTHGHPQTPEYIRDATQQLVAEFGVQGILLLASKYQVDVFQAARMSIAPVVVVEGEYSPVAVHQVYYDNREAGYRAGSALIKSGHERLLYFAPYCTSWVADRRAGIGDAAASREIPITVYLDSDTDPASCRDDQEGIARQFARTVPVEDIEGAGIIACNDAAAIGLMQVAAESGLVAGVDYSIIGFDDLPSARSHGLASLKPPMRAIGEHAARMLSQLASGRDCPMRAYLNSELVMRKSVRRPISLGSTPVGPSAEAALVS